MVEYHSEGMCFAKRRGTSISPSSWPVAGRRPAVLPLARARERHDVGGCESGVVGKIDIDENSALVEGSGKPVRVQAPLSASFKGLNVLFDFGVGGEGEGQPELPRLGLSFQS